MDLLLYQEVGDRKHCISHDTRVGFPTRMGDYEKYILVRFVDHGKILTMFAYQVVSMLIK